MDQALIFQPMSIYAGLMILLTGWLAWGRVGSVARGKVNMRDVANQGWQGWIKNAGDNYSNQYEAPVLFFIVCIMIFLMSGVTRSVMVAAWFFVGFRVVHALIHLSVNNVLYRFLAFALSMIPLAYLSIVVLILAF